MTGDKGFLAIVMIGLEGVVDNAAKTGIASVQARGFLVSKSVRKVQQEAVGIAMLELSLECVGAAMAKISITEQKISKSGKRLSS